MKKNVKLTRIEMEKRIAMMRENDGIIFDYLEENEDDLTPLSLALDEMQDAMDNAIADGDPNIIEGNGKILANLVRVQPYAHPDELVRLSDDLDYVRCSDEEITRIFNKCNEILQSHF